ncbi:tetratricopeptide repeat protein [Thiotrichales bacterium 19S11-10]|nr:tetratricopeptide repeat protein [Thiotrichales bacterium 19S11-10]
MRKIIKQIKINQIARKILNFFVLSLALIICPFLTIASENNKNQVVKSTAYTATDFFNLMLAEIAINRQYWPEAASLYAHLANHTNEEEIKANALELLFALGLIERAEPLVSQWNKAQPDSQYAKIYLAKLYLFERKHKEAEMILYGMTFKEKLAEEIIFLKALLAYDRQENNQSIKYFTQLLTSEDYKENALLFIAKLYVREGKIEEAIIYYGKVEHGALFYHAQLSLVTLYIYQKTPEYALKHVSKMLPYISHEKYRKRFIYMKGMLELLLSDTQAAFDTFNQGVVEYPKDGNFYYLRGLSHLSLGNSEKAEADMVVVLDLDPNHHQALSTLAFIYAEYHKRYDESYKLLKKAHKLAPKAPQVLDSLGWLMYKQGHHKEALAYLEEAYDLLPYGDVASHYVGVLEASGQNEKAQAVERKRQDDKANGYDVQQLIQHYRGTWND